MEEDKSDFKILQVTYKKKTPRRPLNRWEDNVRKEIGINTRSLIDLAQDKL